MDVKQFGVKAIFGVTRDEKGGASDGNTCLVTAVNHQVTRREEGGGGGARGHHASKLRSLSAR